LITALYLAHLNPVTNAHIEIISELKKEADIVKVMPVVFKDEDREVNSKSFPFNFETRKKMLMSVFGDSIQITDDYAFFSPFKKYLPPLLRRRSWKLIKPKLGERKSLSASSVKEKLFDAALGKESTWKEDVPESIAKIIEEDWKTVEKFANEEDMTRRVAGMKFPKEGYSK